MHYHPRWQRRPSTQQNMVLHISSMKASIGRPGELVPSFHSLWAGKLQSCIYLILLRLVGVCTGDCHVFLLQCSMMDPLLKELQLSGLPELCINVGSTAHACLWHLHSPTAVTALNLEYVCCAQLFREKWSLPGNQPNINLQGKVQIGMLAICRLKH